MFSCQKILSLAFFLFSLSAFAIPAQVVIIRHGEKPPQGNQVNSQGCERAFSLPTFFEDNAMVQAFGAPVAIYAQAPDKEDGSLRPVETIAPTALDLQMKVDTQYTHKMYQEMVQEILQSRAYEGKTVLIAWEHTAIPTVAQAFGIPAAQTPQPWPGEVFDQAWVIRFTNSQKTKGAKAPASATLQIIPESVLPTDNPFGGSQWNAGPVAADPQHPVASNIVQICASNESLNEVVQEVAMPTLDPASFVDAPSVSDPDPAPAAETTQSRGQNSRRQK